MSHHRAVMEDFTNFPQKIKGVIGIRNFWTTGVVSCNNESKKGGKNQESIQSSTSPDLGYHLGKWQKCNYTSQTRANRSVLSQQVTTRQQWTDAKAWQTEDINKTNDPQKMYRLWTFLKNILLVDLNQFHGASYSCIIYHYHSFFYSFFSFYFLSLSFSFTIFFLCFFSFLLLFLSFLFFLSLFDYLIQF